MKNLLILSIFIQGCLEAKHEDTLCRHSLRQDSVEQQGLNGDDISAIISQRASSSCGSSDFTIVETSSLNNSTIFKYKCNNVCDSESTYNPGSGQTNQ